MMAASVSVKFWAQFYPPRGLVGFSFFSIAQFLTVITAVLDKARYVIRVVTPTTQGSMYTLSLRETL
jgi:hypothetical protein